MLYTPPEMVVLEVAVEGGYSNSGSEGGVGIPDWEIV